MVLEYKNLLIGIILNYFIGVNVGKYSSTMDPMGMATNKDFTHQRVETVETGDHQSKIQW